MAWKKGESGNLKGRPRSGNSLAEAIRRKLDPDDVVEKLWEIAQTSPSDQTRLRAMEILLSSGYKKPAQVIEVGPADPFEDMSEEELRALIDQDDAQIAELEAGSEPNPALVGGQSGSVGGASAAEPVRRLSVGEAASPVPGRLHGDTCSTTSHLVTHVGAHATMHAGVLVRKRMQQSMGDDDESNT